MMRGGGNCDGDGGGGRSVVVVISDAVCVGIRGLYRHILCVEYTCIGVHCWVSCLMHNTCTMHPPPHPQALPTHQIKHNPPPLTHTKSNTNPTFSSAVADAVNDT